MILVVTQSLAYNPKAARFLDAAYDEEVSLRRSQGRQVRSIAEFAAVGGSRRSVTEEVALAFSVSRNHADLLVETSCALVRRLPNTLAALERGEIDLFKASKVSRLTREVSDEVAALVDGVQDESAHCIRRRRGTCRRGTYRRGPSR